MPHFLFTFWFYFKYLYILFDFKYYKFQIENFILHYNEMFWESLWDLIKYFQYLYYVIYINYWLI